MGKEPFIVEIYKSKGHDHYHGPESISIMTSFRDGCWQVIDLHTKEQLRMVHKAIDLYLKIKDPAAGPRRVS